MSHATPPQPHRHGAMPSVPDVLAGRLRRPSPADRGLRPTSSPTEASRRIAPSDQGRRAHIAVRVWRGYWRAMMRVVDGMQAATHWVGDASARQIDDAVARRRSARGGQP